MNGRKPIHLMAGGDFRQPSGMIPRIKTILAETGKTHPTVAYIGTANDDNAAFFKFTAGIIKQAGSFSVSRVLLSGKKADVSRVRSLLDAADAVFISGGDVEKGIRTIQRYNLIPFLRSLYGSGKVFFGISAGSIMLGTHWVRWKNPNDDSYAELFECIGIAPVVCDTHAENDGWEELTAAVYLLKEGSRGYGIPTGGTLRLEPDGTLAALDTPVVCYEKKSGVVISPPPLKAQRYAGH